MKRMACNSYRWKAANLSKDWRIRRRIRINDSTYLSPCLCLCCNSFWRYKLLQLHLHQPCWQRHQQNLSLYVIHALLSCPPLTLSSFPSRSFCVISEQQSSNSTEST
jgi:hypothetical protein